LITVFADTLYFIATSRPRDQWAGPARMAEENLGEFKIVTTDAILVEFLGALAKGGVQVRGIAIRMVEAILNNANVKVVPQGRDLFLKGLEFYQNRQDKEYSLTDCISMVVMKDENISKVLTHDHHFEQEGFEILIKKDGTLS